MQCSALHDSDKDISQAYLFAFLKRLAQPFVFLVLKLYFDCKVRDLRWNQQKNNISAGHCKVRDLRWNQQKNNISAGHCKVRDLRWNQQKNNIAQATFSA